MKPTHVRFAITVSCAAIAAAVLVPSCQPSHPQISGVVDREDCNGTPQNGNLYQRIPPMRDSASILAMIGDCGGDGTYRAQVRTTRGTEIVVKVSRAVYRTCLPSTPTPTLYPKCTEPAQVTA